jgi:hypothetical protein
LLKPEIIAKVNHGLGWEAIRDITLRLGEVSCALKPAIISPRNTSISPEERVEMERCIQEIRDPEIQAALRRLMEKDLLSRKSERPE